jgi:hypothetical protein
MFLLLPAPKHTCPVSIPQTALPNHPWAEVGFTQVHFPPLHSPHFWLFLSALSGSGSIL